jgi:hypothetical protein
MAALKCCSLRFLSSSSVGVLLTAILLQEPRLRGHRASFPGGPHLHDHPVQLPVRNLCLPSYRTLHQEASHHCSDRVGSTSLRIRWLRPSLLVAPSF